MLPPVVGGAGLLLAFGRRGLAGRFLGHVFGISLPFTTAGAILAASFVSMPFMVITVGLRSIDSGWRRRPRRWGQAAPRYSGE